MDKIKIKDLEVFGNHGVHPEENRLGQKFIVSCTLSLDTRRAGMDDSLSETVSYGSITRIINKEMSENTYQLLEAAAERLAEKLLQYNDMIRQVDLEIKKPWAPIGLPLQYVSVEIHRKWHEVYIGLGSNIGDRRTYIESAVNELGHTPGCRIEKISSFIETEPYGGVEQDMFLNGVLKLWTTLTPRELLELLHQTEKHAGRERTIHWGPRTLDLDILFYDDDIIGEDDLCIPHIDLVNREFVLKPMAELAPYKRHPVYGTTMTEMLETIRSII